MTFLFSLTGLAGDALEPDSEVGGHQGGGRNRTQTGMAKAKLPLNVNFPNKLI